MKTSFKTQFLFAVSSLLLIAAFIPEQNIAQRFNHASAPRATMPVNRPPATSMPARRPETPVFQQPQRPSINGGGRNIGNHDFNRNVNVNVHDNVNMHQPVHENVTVHDNVTVHNNVNVRPSVRDHVNVYHTGGYRGLH